MFDVILGNDSNTVSVANARWTAAAGAFASAVLFSELARKRQADGKDKILGLIG